MSSSSIRLRLEIVWQHTPKEAGLLHPTDSNRYYSPFISSAQRLPNGNTLITEGSGGRIFEVTPEHEMVWEYISPYWGKMMHMNMVYRAYRVPYEWVPQLDSAQRKPHQEDRRHHFPCARSCGARPQAGDRGGRRSAVPG